MTPEFVGETAEKAAPVLMKYDMETKTWKANTDEGNCSFDMKWAVEGIQYSKEGSVHNFTTSKAIDGEKIVKQSERQRKDHAAENLLIWNHEGSKRMQVLSTGSASPPEFFMRLKTDVPAEVTVEKKDAETGKSIPAEQTQYKVKSLDLNRYVSRRNEKERRGSV